MASIQLNKDGPMVVKGVTDLKNSRGEALKAEETMYLCRCGGSANKPYCDGTHRKNGFKDEKN